MKTGTYAIRIAFMTLILVALAFAALFTGSERIPARDIISCVSAAITGGEYDPFVGIIVFDLRLSRTILAVLCGALLAGAGVLFQGFFRNGLADPSGMGISAGATLGAAGAALIPAGASAGFAALGASGSFLTAALVAGTGFLSAGLSGLCAFAGALATAWFVYAVAGRAGRGGTASAPVALLLTGAAVSAFFSAVTSLILLMNERELYRVYLWTMGGFSGRGWNDVAFLLPAAVVSAFLAFPAARPLDLLAGGETAAASLGADLSRTRLLVIAAGSLAAAGAAAAGGTIGFVGLIAPHIARMLTGPSHRRLLLSGALTGSILLLAADIAARTLLAPAEIPVGIITALMGAPFFVWLLAKGHAV